VILTFPPAGIPTIKMLAGTVMLGDLNDFIAPSQACVNPILAAKPQAGAGSAEGVSKVTLSLDYDEPKPSLVVGGKRPNLIKADATSNAAKVSLNDCLACSGCVTSAETILITQQSTAEMRKALADRSKYTLRVASVSPQALASLAVHYGLTDPADCFERLRAFLTTSLEFDAVVDTVVAAEISLLESADEFVRRVRAARRTPAAPASGVASAAHAAPSRGKIPWVAPTPTVAVSATHSKLVPEGSNAWSADLPLVDHASFSTSSGVWSGGAAGGAASVATAASESSVDSGSARSVSGPLPVLASSCPGWVCYAEKTVPESLPFVSAVKSPQQVAGALLKHLLSGGGLVPSDTAAGGGAAVIAAREPFAAPAAASAARVYHVTIMPCYDRKLEASRRDFAWEQQGTAAKISGSASGGRGGLGDSGVAAPEAVPEVDCVLATGEIIDLLSESGVHLADVVPAEEGEGGQGAARRSAACCEPGSGCAAAAAAVADLPSSADRMAVEGEDGSGCRRGGCCRCSTAQASAVAASAAASVSRIERMLTGCTRRCRSCGVSASGGCSSSAAAVLALSAVEGSSDGYCDFVLRYAAAELLGVAAVAAAAPGAGGSDADAAAAAAAAGGGGASAAGAPPSAGSGAAHPAPTVTYAFSAGRNADFREATLSVGGVRQLSFAIAYGFRNIQAIVQRLRRGRCEFDYVEVMACPSGCANGGGQAKHDAPVLPRTAAADAAGVGAAADAGAAVAAAGESLSAGTGAFLSMPLPRDPVKQRIAAVRGMMQAGAAAGSLPPANVPSTQAAAVYEALRGGDAAATDRLRRLLLHTQYHHVAKLETGLTAKW
jgi:iron only hydrogenase large subunit-like protein